MKRIIFLMMFVMCGMNLFGAKVRSYNISKDETIRLVYNTTKVVFKDNFDEWNDILIGTLCAETDLGAYRGGSKHGIAQITPVAYKFIRNSVLKDKETYEKLRDDYGLDFKNISFNELTNNHKASITAMALYYKYLVEAKGVNIHGLDKAYVWKKYYNTYAGAGTHSHFNKVYNRNKDIIKETIFVCKNDDFMLAKAELQEEFKNDLRQEILNRSYAFVEDTLKEDVRTANVIVKVNKDRKFTTFVATYKPTLNIIKMTYNLVHTDKYKALIGFAS